MLALIWRVLLTVIPLCVLVGYPRDAQAYPWMIRHGYGGCATCHADPSGGELLTKYGRAQGELLLRMHYGQDTSSARASTATQSGSSSFDDFESFEPKQGSLPAPTPAPEKAAPPEPDAGPPASGFLWGLWDTPEPLLFGGSVRLAAFAQGGARVFPMQMDVYGQLRLGPILAGGSIGAARVKQSSPNARAAFVTTNQGNDFNVVSRTHYLGVALGSDSAWTVRAGRLNLPFGVRIPEHYAWVRDITRTDRESDQQHGAAVAFSGRALRAEVMGIAGNYQINPDRYRERGYSGFAELLVSSDVGVGVSSLVTVAKADRVSLEQERTTRGAHGAFARAQLATPLVLLAEADVLHLSRRALGYVGFAQLDYELTQGLHLLGTGEALDTGRHDVEPGGFQPESLPGEGKPRFGGWASVDWFFLPQLELRVDLIGRQDMGGAALAQLHAYL